MCFLLQSVLFVFCTGNELFFVMLYLVYFTPGPTSKDTQHTCTHMSSNRHTRDPSKHTHAYMHSHYCHGNDKPSVKFSQPPRCLFPLHLQFHSCFGLLVCGTSSWQSVCLLHWARTLSMPFSLWRQHRPLQPMMWKREGSTQPARTGHHSSHAAHHHHLHTALTGVIHLPLNLGYFIP